MDVGVAVILTILGLLGNVATWSHPNYQSLVVWGIIGTLPFVLIASLKTPKYLLWYILTVFFSQDSFPNNVLYETYYGYEKATVYFHHFLGPLSVFDVVLLGALYVLAIRHIRSGTITQLWGGRWEYWVLLGVTTWGVAVGWSRGNPLKEVFSEYQTVVYAFLMFVLVRMSILDKEEWKQSLWYLVVLLTVTLPLEFYHYVSVNYHNILYVVGRMRKPILNGVDDTNMLIPLFFFLNLLAGHWAVLKKNKSILILSLFGILSGLGVVFLNNGRMLTILGAGLLILFFVLQKLRWQIWVLVVLSVTLLFGGVVYYKPNYVKRLGQSFSTILTFVQTQNITADESAGDRVLEFVNVHLTLKETDNYLWGMGWGGKWDEYYHQPGRGSLAAYADKTPTRHAQTHVLFSYLTVKLGYLGMGLVVLAFLSLWIHLIRYARWLLPSDVRWMSVSLLYIFPVYFYFSLVFQVGIVFGLILALIRQAERLYQPEDTD